MTLLFLWACGQEPPPVLLDIPDFSLVDTANKPVTRSTFAGKVWLADFIFTSCQGPCPILSAQMAEIQEHYRDEPELLLVSFTVDPQNDTPPVLGEYARRFQANPERWFFLTGEPAMVRATIVDGMKQLMENIPATVDQPANVLHSERLVLIDRQGKIRAFPDFKEKEALYQAVDLVLKEGRGWF